MKGDCIIWQGYIDRSGYGKRRQGDQMKLAHRVAWEDERGPIPEGLTIDHLCRTRACVNVDHMEVVTKRENTLRGVGPAAVNAQKTHCKHGHLLDAKNTYIRPGRGGRDCRKCGVERTRRYQERRVA